MISPSVSRFVVSPSQMAIDHRMVPFDIWGTRVHTLMLMKCRIISREAGISILDALQAIEIEWSRGEYQIDPERGAQLTLEKKLVAHAGETAGLSAHTARSRNDQVMVTELLYLRERVCGVIHCLLPSLEALLECAAPHIHTVMPGYTHMQPGKPTTYAHWCLTHHDGIARGIGKIFSVLEEFDMCPLGAVESFGTSWPIDRDYSARLLGFARIWEVPCDAISSRGIFQRELLGAFERVAAAIAKLATDIMLYTTHEYNLLTLGEAVAARLHPITGSSVMAQKRNPDAVELLRALSPQLTGLSFTVSALLSHLPSGYNRDSREVKEYVELGTEKMLSSAEALQSLLASCHPNVARMRDVVIANYSLTTDLADGLAQRAAIPYRQMYKIVGKVVDSLMSQGKLITQISAESLQHEAAKQGVNFSPDQSHIDSLLEPEGAIARRTHRGGCAEEAVTSLMQTRRSALRDARDRLARFEQKVAGARTATCQEELAQRSGCAP